MAHLGRASCPNCGWTSARPRLVAELVSSPSLGMTRLRIDGTLFDVPAGRLYNAYNAAAAIVTAAAFGVPDDAAIRSLSSFHARFGRCERFDIDGRTAWLLLMKNPASAASSPNNSARIATSGPSSSPSTIDRGRSDISWIWDSDFVRLADLGIPLVPSGVRAADVAVRLRYAGAAPVTAEPRPVPAIGMHCRCAPRTDRSP